METFSELLALCAGHSSITGELPSQKRFIRRWKWDNYWYIVSSVYYVLYLWLHESSFKLLVYGGLYRVSEH